MIDFDRADRLEQIGQPGRELFAEPFQLVGRGRGKRVGREREAGKADCQRIDRRQLTGEPLSTFRHIQNGGRRSALQGVAGLLNDGHWTIASVVSIPKDAAGSVTLICLHVDRARRPTRYAPAGLGSHLVGSRIRSNLDAAGVCVCSCPSNDSTVGVSSMRVSIWTGRVHRRARFRSVSRA